MQQETTSSECKNINKSNRSSLKYSPTKNANITKTTFDKTCGDIDKTNNSVTFKKTSQLSLIANYKKRENIAMRYSPFVQRYLTKAKFETTNTVISWKMKFSKKNLRQKQVDENFLH